MPPPLFAGMASLLRIGSRKAVAGSDDDVSSPDVVDVPVKAGKKQGKKLSMGSKPEPIDVEENGEVEDIEDNSEDDEEELFVVEAILDHLIDDDGTIKFRVKWEGYDKKSDQTWEPEANLLGSASEILGKYYDSIGGKDYVLSNKPAPPKPKKRLRKSETIGTSDTKSNGKRSKKEHPAESTPPASVEKFKLPTGSWEEDVTSIDACEGTEGNIMVFLQWKDGARTQHTTQTVYRRCPQKMLKFYESHLVFKRGGGTEKELNEEKEGLETKT